MSRIFTLLCIPILKLKLTVWKPTTFKCLLTGRPISGSEVTVALQVRCDDIYAHILHSEEHPSSPPHVLQTLRCVRKERSGWIQEVL